MLRTLPVVILTLLLLTACDDGSSPAPTDPSTSTSAPSNISTQPPSDTPATTPVQRVTPEATATLTGPTPEPTPDQAPTDTPTPELSPVEIGMTVEAGGSSYTLNEIKDPAPEGLFEVDAGKRLVALDITQVGISDDGDPYNSLYFAVQDTDGYVYDPGFAEQADVGPSFGFGELAAGQTVRGWVVFELPESARLVSVLVEAEVLGAKITIADLAQYQVGDIVSLTPPPVPAPPASPVEIGTTVESGGSSYTLNEVKDPAPAGLFEVDAGKRLVALDITQVGISDDGDPYNSLYFAVQDTDGYVYVPGFAEQADVGPSFGFGELAAGQTVRGWVVFELPESARLVSVLVEAELLGAKITIADLEPDQDGDIVSLTPTPFPTPSPVATATPTQVRTPTPIPTEKALSTMQMNINDSKGNDIKTLEQWSASVSRAHWVEGRSAYALADFILNRNGTAYLESRISSVLSQPVRLEQGAPEYAAKFDQYGTPARLDIGISGQTASGESLFVGGEAKVDEPFGSETVCERYQEAVEYLKSNPRSKAAARVEELLSRYLADNDEPCESRFADVGYQLLTASAGTVAAEADISVFYVMVFKTRLYNGEKGEENRFDYENFINLVGGECLMRDNEVCLAHGITLNGRRLICIYQYFDVEG